MSDYIRFNFAETGERDTVPDTEDSGGEVSLAEGYGEKYSFDLRTNPDALPIERVKFNEILHRVTKAIRYLQRFSVPEFITTADNGGTPFAYSQFTRVRYEGAVYESLVNSNTTLPTNTTNWRQVNTFAPSGVTAGTYNNANVTVNAQGIVTAASNGASPIGLLDGFEVFSGSLPSTLPWSSAQAASISQSGLNVTQGTSSCRFNASGAVTMTATLPASQLVPFGELLVDVSVASMSSGNAATLTCGAETHSTPAATTGNFTLRVPIPSGATTISLAVSGASEVFWDNLRYIVRLDAQGVTFDDAGLDNVSGLNVQAVLESVDDEISSINDSMHWELIEARTVSSNVEDFTNLSDYRDIMVVFDRVGASSSGIRNVRVSANNGISFLTGVYYQSNTNAASDELLGFSSSTTGARNGRIVIHNFNTTNAIKPVETTNNTTSDGVFTHIVSASAFNALRCRNTAGNLSGGTIYVYGRKG